MANLGADKRVQVYDAATDTWVNEDPAKLLYENMSNASLVSSAFLDPIQAIRLPSGDQSAYQPLLTTGRITLVCGD